MRGHVICPLRLAAYNGGIMPKRTKKDGNLTKCPTSIRGLEHSVLWKVPDPDGSRLFITGAWIDDIGDMGECFLSPFAQCRVRR